MEKGLVSVIIPVYNVEQYLRQCLDSVLNQTYTNYEVIMVDDGSIDSSGIICDEYTVKDNRFRVIHRKNGGLSVARNTGFDNAAGEYVYYMDSDDWIEKTTLEKLVDKAIETNADFVFFDGKSFEDSEKGYNIKQGYKRKHEYAPDVGLDVFDELQRNRDMHFPVQMYFYKRSFLEENGLKFYPGILYEDVVFTFEAFCKANLVAHCHEGLYHRRFRAGSIVTTKPTEKNYVSAVIVFSEIIRIANDNHVFDKQSVIDYITRVAMRPLNIYSQLPEDDKRRIEEQHKEYLSKIRKAKGYGNRALYYRTYGKIPWAARKAVEKIIRR